MRVINILALLGSVSSHKLSLEWIGGADDMLKEAGTGNMFAHEGQKK